MNESKEILRLIQSHKALEPFDYKLAVEWAIDLIRQGRETDNVLMLASFSEPIEKHEISPYVTAVLTDLELEELECDDGLIAQTHFLLSRILKGEAVRENLQSLSQVCINNEYDKRIMDFYLLHHGWGELEDVGVNYYYEGADLDNIDEVLKMAAKIWIDKYIYDRENLEIQQELKEERRKTQPTKNVSSWWKKLWS